MGKIVCGFVATGKSTISNYHPEISTYDLDSTYFKKEPGWEKVYIDCAVALAKQYDVVCITTYESVMRLLNSRGVNWCLVYPERGLKEEYRRRVIARRSPMEFTDSFFSRWDAHIDLAEKIDCPKKIVLKLGQYLADVLDKIV